MRQPIIDPDKVSAWTESMRGMFANNTVGTLLVLGFTLAFLTFVIYNAWVVSKEPRHRI